MFSSTSHAEWMKVLIGEGGVPSYIDFERIRKHDGYVYYWTLSDYLTLSPSGYLSGMSYSQGDCNLMRVKPLRYVLYKLPMGQGLGDDSTPIKNDWKYPRPNSVSEGLLKSVCNL